MCRCACVAQIITVGSSAHVQAVELLNEHHPVFRALDVLASKCLVDESTNHSQDHPFLTHIGAFTLLSKSRSCLVLNLFKQKLPPWSVTSEVSTSDLTKRVECLGPKQHNYRKVDATSACAARGSAEIGHVVVGAQHSAYTRRAVLFPTFPTTLGRDLTRVSVRFGTSTLGPPNCFQFTAALQLEWQVLVTWSGSTGALRAPASVSL